MRKAESTRPLPAAESRKGARVGLAAPLVACHCACTPPARSAPPPRFRRKAPTTSALGVLTFLSFASTLLDHDDWNPNAVIVTRCCKVPDAQPMGPFHPWVPPYILTRSTVDRCRTVLRLRVGGQRRSRKTSFHRYSWRNFSCLPPLGAAR